VRAGDTLAVTQIGWSCSFGPDACAIADELTSRKVKQHRRRGLLPDLPDRAVAVHRPWRRSAPRETCRWQRLGGRPASHIEAV